MNNYDFYKDELEMIKCVGGSFAVPKEGDGSPVPCDGCISCLACLFDGEGSSCTPQAFKWLKAEHTDVSDEKVCVCRDCFFYHKAEGLDNHGICTVDHPPKTVHIFHAACSKARAKE